MSEVNLHHDGIATKAERRAICAAKSVLDLRDLLFAGKVTINDVRAALGLPDLPEGDVFYQRFDAQNQSKESAA